MKRILGLGGLVFVGFMLLYTPTTGVVAVAQSSMVATDAPTTTSTTVAAAPPDPSPTSTAGSAETTTTTGPPTTTTTQTAQAITVKGDAVSSPYGPFQVEISVDNGKIVDVTTLVYPQDRTSRSINAQVLPYYTSAALDAQSTDFNAISGATITWKSWRASLASAMDAANV